jgi:hypothetical protein
MLVLILFKFVISNTLETFKTTEYNDVELLKC